METRILKDSDRVAIIASYLKYSTKNSIYPKYWHYVAFVNVLVRKRKELNFTVEFVARNLGLNLGTYIKFEEGKQRIPAKLIVKLMDLLNVQIYELGGGKDPNAPILAKLAQLEQEQLAREKVHLGKIDELQGLVATQGKVQDTLKVENSALKNKQIQQEQEFTTFKTETITKYEVTIKELKVELTTKDKKIKELEGKLISK